MPHNFLHDPSVNETVDDIVTLLKLCHQLQSEKDGRERLKPDAYSREEDDFADRIRMACGHVGMLRHLLPMRSLMILIGTELEKRGEISVITGESYAHKALEFLMAKYLQDNFESL